MNLYKIWRDTEDGIGYDTFDSAVVAAENEESARNIHPAEDWARENGFPLSDYSDEWPVDPEDVEVEFIGVAKEGTASGVIVASYNAG